MRRFGLPLVAVPALALLPMAPAEAATPLSVAGTGATKVFVATTSTYKVSTKTVTVATTGSAGELAIQGVSTRRVNCVQSGVRNGVKVVVVGTAASGGRKSFLLINEGGGADLVKPWAIAYDLPTSVYVGGACNTSVNLSKHWFYGDSEAKYRVPAHRYTVVGG